MMVVESMIEVNARLDTWRSMLEEKGQNINTAKIKYPWCNFIRETNYTSIDVSIREQTLPSMDSFKYLGYMIYKDADVEVDAIQHIKVGCIKRSFIE